MKTPITEIIEDLKNLGIYTTTLKEICEVGLEKERQMVIDAGDKCIKNWVNYDPERHGNESPSGKQYFNLTYNNK